MDTSDSPWSTTGAAHFAGHATNPSDPATLGAAWREQEIRRQLDEAHRLLAHVADLNRRDRLRAAPPACFGILGVAPEATEADIRKAYHRRARKMHPDHGGNASDFDRLRQAYTEAVKRARGEWVEVFRFSMGGRP